MTTTNPTNRKHRAITAALITAMLILISMLVLSCTAPDASARMTPRWQGSTTHVTWYGPGYYWHGYACGGTYNPRDRAVASNSFPCGTRLTLRYHGRIVRTVVRDTGGFSHLFDSTARTQMDLLGCRSYCTPYTIEGRVDWIRGWHDRLRPTPLR